VLPGQACGGLISHAHARADAEQERPAASSAALEATQGDLPTITRSDRVGFVLRLRGAAQPFVSLQMLRARKSNSISSTSAADYFGTFGRPASEPVRNGRFTIDALIKNPPAMGNLRQTIVSLIDESKAPIAMVARTRNGSKRRRTQPPGHPVYRQPNSPSETLARVVMNIRSISYPTQTFVMCQTTRRRFPAGIANRPRTSPSVSVCGNPSVTKSWPMIRLHVAVIDSSRFTDYIVDCLVGRP